jgi:hypothetical protein
MVKGGLPVECSCEDEEIVGADLVQTIVEVLVVDQAAGLVDDDESEDDPVREQDTMSPWTCGWFEKK